MIINASNIYIAFFVISWR